MSGSTASRARGIASSSLATFAARALQILLTVVAYRRVLSVLPPEQASVWVQATSVAVIASFMDLGLGSGLLTLFPRYAARGGPPAAAAVFWTALRVIGAAMVGGVVLALVLLGLIDWPRAFHVAAEGAPAAAPTAVVVACSLVLAVPAAFATRALVASEHGTAAAGFQSLGFLLSFALLLVGPASPPAWWFAAVVLVPPQVGPMLALAWLLHREPWLRDHRGGDVDRDVLSALWRLGGGLFLLQLLGAGLYSLDVLLVGQFVGAEHVATWSVHAQLLVWLLGAVNVVLNQAWPSLSAAWAREDRAWVRRVLALGAAAALAVGVTGALGARLFGPWLLSAWVGERVRFDGALAFALALWAAAAIAGAVVSTTLNAAGKIRFQLWTAAATVALGVVLKWFGARAGLAGIAGAGVVAYVTVTLVPSVSYLIVRVLPKPAPQPEAPRG